MDNKEKKELSESDIKAKFITSPQDPNVIVSLMTYLEHFINKYDRFPADPLIKMALIHHQFESIHPFYDGTVSPADVHYAKLVAITPSSPLIY